MGEWAWVAWMDGDGWGWMGIDEDGWGWMEMVCVSEEGGEWIGRWKTFEEEVAVGRP